MRQWTAPFLGAACLALLALASAHNLPAEVAQLAAGRGLTFPPTTWLEGPTSNHSLLGAATALAARGAATYAQRAGQSPVHAGWPAVSRTRTSRSPATPLAQGSVSLLALLVSVMLALCR